MLNFDADVKKTTARHQCENRLTHRALHADAAGKVRVASCWRHVGGDDATGGACGGGGGKDGSTVGGGEGGAQEERAVLDVLVPRALRGRRRGGALPTVVLFTPRGTCGISE